MIALIVIVIILLVFAYLARDNIEKFHVKYESPHATFEVLSTYENNTEAGKLIGEVIKRIKKLRAYVNDKYSKAQVASPLVKDMINRFNTLFDPDNIKEIDPLNSKGMTSYVENKGEVIGLCVRDQRGKLHDINTVMFVTLHEVSHIINNELQHETPFWRKFKWLVSEAINAEVYIPIDYGKNVESYCGMSVYYSPYYDKTLDRIK